MKKLLIASMLLIAGMQISAQNADLSIGSALMNVNPISINQTAQLVVEVRNNGFTDLTAGCATVTVSVPGAISNITGLNGGSNAIWTVQSSTLTSMTLRNLGGALPADGNPYYVLIDVKGIANGGPLTISANSSLTGNGTQAGCGAQGDVPGNNNTTTSIRVGPKTFFWTGATDTNWDDPNNWATIEVPASIDNAIIPDVPNKPALNSAATTINNLNIDPAMLVDLNGKNLRINGSLSGTGLLKGAPTSDLTIGGAAGTIRMDQTSASTRSVANLLLQAPTASASLAASGDDIVIYSSLVLQPGTSLNLNNQNLTLKSVGTGVLQSAYIGNLTGASLTGAGNVTIERFIATPQRAWHLLSARGVTGPLTIKDTWQESAGAYVAGLGTLVTSNLYSPTNGFDVVSNSASILTHNQGGLSGASWNYNLASTNVTPLSANPGYMLFVRGDRSYTPANLGTAPTVLRTKGTLTQGPQSAFISSLGTGRTLVGNPYTSPIDMDGVFTGTANLAQDMFIWDPSLGGVYGVGGFRVVERIGLNDYQATPSISIPADNTMRYIHAGQAFLLRTTGTAGITDATVNFTEAMKTVNLSVVNPIVAAVSPQIVTNLLVVNAGNTATLTDGFRVRYDASFKANTSDDILKMGNFGENISSYREDKKLIVEKRPLPSVYDTIFIRLSNMATGKDYRFELNTQDFIPGFNAYLQDNYKGTTTPVDLTGNTTQVNFNLTSDAASAAPDRFRIVFALKVIPVTTTTIKAAQKNEDIAVDFKAANQFNMKHYEIEKSIDGSTYNKVATQPVIGANGTDATYAWIDVNAVTGDNYYRIRQVGNSGETGFSNIAKVTIDKNNRAITVYPNPVTNRNITLQMTNMEKGVYKLSLISTTGQVVMTSQVTHGGGNAVQSVPLIRQVANGAYRLEITKPDNSRVLKDLVIADQ